MIGAHRRIAALVKKEFLQMQHDPSSILIGIVLPALLLFLYGFGISLDIHNMKMGIVIEDTAPDARSWAASFTHSPYFDPIFSTDRAPFEREITRAKIKGFVVVPSYFSAFRENPNESAPVQVIADGSDPNTANLLQSYVQESFRKWLASRDLSYQEGNSSLIHLEPRYRFNENLESRYFILPGSLAIIMTVVGTLLTSLVIAREWERGTLEALFATPVTAWEFLISKFIAYFLLGLFSFSFAFLTATLLYQIPFRGSFLILLFIVSVFLGSTLGLGLLISTLTKNQFAAAQASIVIAFLPSFILSGFIFEISSMPTLIQYLSYLLPARYLVPCLKTLFLVGNVPRLLLSQTAILFVFALLLFLLCIRKTHKSLE